MKNDMSKQPGFDRLRKLMDDPRYWRDQDPSYVEMIRQGFRDLYDSPSQAGEAANLAGVNGPLHAQDTEVGHLTKGEIVIPRSAQTPEVIGILKQVLGNDLVSYTVGSGYEHLNPTSGLPAFADQGFFQQVWNATSDMARNYLDMRDANTIGADKYFHCKANYDASAHGRVASGVAEKISDVRELYGRHVNGDAMDDTIEDQLANKWGRSSQRSRKYKTASEACATYRPDYLDEKY